MAKLCSECGNQLSFLRGLSHSICQECEDKKRDEDVKLMAARDAEKERIKNEIIHDKAITDAQIETLKIYDRNQLVLLYDEIFNQYEINGLEKDEISALAKMQNALSLTDDDIKFEEKILPHIFVYSIKTENKLPRFVFDVAEGISKIVLKKGEEMYYATPVRLKEMRVVDLGYEGGSHGVSFPIGGGIRYRVGATRGHVFKEERMIETSQGFLLVTNKRLLLQPMAGHKSISLPLDKILSYNCFENGIEIYKEGREKAYFFQTLKTSGPENVGIILEFLLRNNNET